MVQEDPSLAGIGSLVFDEFHERSVQADLGLALALEARNTFHPDLRLLLMSATMRVDRFAAFIQGVSLEIEGRSFPVETEYRAVTEGPGFEAALAELAAEYLAKAGDIGRRDGHGGDLLVFLPGVAEIEAVGRHIRNRAWAQGQVPEVLALHGSLALDQQRKILSPREHSKRQRMILATSIAETSLTVPGISAVLDSGLARLSRFEVKSGLNRLVTERESGDRADQRRGRAGRLGPGICIRAWARSESLPEATQPEILRAELSALVLEASAWGAIAPTDLPWLDSPPAAAWEAARGLLEELGAVDGRGKINPFGLACLRMGTEPRLAALVLHGQALGRLREAAGLAALIAERGGAEADLGLALTALFSDRPDLASARTEASRLEKTAASIGWNRGQEASGSGRPSLGSLMAAGFPDRVAKRLEYSGGKAIFQLPGGRKLSVRGGLAESSWIVAAEAEGGGGRYAKTGEGRVFSGTGVDEEEALIALSPLLSEEQRIDWDGLRARARMVRRVGAILLSEHPLGAPSKEALEEALEERLGKEGLRILPWEEGAGDILERMRWYLDRRDSQGPEWPSLSDSSLIGSIGSWLLPFLETDSPGPCISAQALMAAVLSIIPASQSRSFDRDVPASLALPSGRRARLRYDKDQLGPGGSKIGPTLEARPQDLYGLRIHPSVLGFPILIRLVSPAGRPIHLTTDMPAFWMGAWKEVRKDLKGRYPKHDWPEDPINAAPGRPNGQIVHGKS